MSFCQRILVTFVLMSKKEEAKPCRRTKIRPDNAYPP